MREPLPLVRDVLDKQVVDGSGLKLGKVDGIALTLRHNRPPRVTAIELDMPTAFRRLSPRPGDWLERLQRWLSPDLVGPTRIRFEHVVKTGIDVEVNIDARKTNAFVWEAWIDAHFIGRLPGGRGGGDKD